MADFAPARVLYLIGSLAVGGAETQLVRLANGLDRNRFQPSIACLWAGDELAADVAPDVPVFKSRLTLDSRRSSVRRAVTAAHVVSEIRFRIRRARPDVVHAYLPAAYVLGGLVAWSLRVPVIVAGRRGLTSYETLGAGRWLGALANRVIDVQICNSEAVRRWAITREGLPTDKTRVVNNGVDLPPAGRQVDIPAEWRSSGVVSGMIANFIAYKGHAEVLRAVAQVAARHPSFRLVLFGDGPEREKLAQLVADLAIATNVVFAGRRVNAADLIPAFDFTILGSSEEGFPNALMESMARSVPVVSTSVGGVTDLVTDDVHGRLVPFGDVKKMAEAISWMIEHPDERRRMGREGRALIAARYSTRRMVEETEAVYDELLRGRRTERAAC